MRSPRGWGQQLAGTPQCSCISGSHLSPYYCLQTFGILFLHGLETVCVFKLTGGSWCQSMSHAFGIFDCCWFYKFWCTNPFVLQPLACTGITEFQLWEWAGTGLKLTGTGWDGRGSYGYWGRIWKWWGWAGIGFNICPRAVL